MATTKVAKVSAVQKAINNITGVTNAKLFEQAQKMSPQFESHTGKKTYDELVKSGYSDFNYSGAEFVNEWFKVMMMPVLNIINVSRAVDRLEAAGFGEVYSIPNGGVIQRLSVNSVKPLSPAYRGLKNGDSVDQQIVILPTVNQRFFKMNFDYQSGITIQDFQVKQIMASDYGMSEFMAGIMEGLRNGYTIQLYENKLEVVNAGINGLAGEGGNAHPLKDTQKIVVDSWTDGAPTDADLLSFVADIQDLITAFETTPQTSAYNANGFADVQDISRLKILVRAGIKKKIMRQLIRTSYHDEVLALPELIEVPHFGGLVPYKEAAFTTQLYPVYDSLGHQLGFSETKGQIGQDNVTVANTDVFWKDPNSKVLAIVADKGWMFNAIQNPYEVRPAPPNARGLYNTYWASSPANGIFYDANYNFVVISKP
nr:MAG TPA: Head protein [Bacteriophage sp.]